MLDVILDALLDTLKLLPLLLAVHVVIEVFEYTAASKIQVNKVLKSRLAPLIGTGLGVVPQCGFSVVATNLYARRAINLGTLLAVYVATSDEAIPILLSDPSAAVKLLPLLGIKIVMALLLGYGVNLILRRRTLVDAPELPTEYGCHGHRLTAPTEQSDAPHTENECAVQPDVHTHEETETHTDTHTHDDALTGTETETTAKKKRKFDYKAFVVHPILHTLTVAGYVLVVNLIFGIILYYVQEERIAAFMETVRYAQPFLAALIGLIPNCASSVAITQMYALGGLHLGAAVAGLAVNAGLGFAVLVKENKNIKENILIIVGMYLYAVAFGLLVTLVAAPYGL